MHLRILLPALLLLGLAPAGRALEFKLREHRVQDLDGGTVDLYFPHESNRVFYRPPPGWTWNGSAASFEAIAPGPRSGRLKITAVKPPADIASPSDGEQGEALKKLALRTLPSDALAPEVIDLSIDHLGGRELACTRITVAYNLSVQERMVIICYAAFRPDLWLSVSIDAAKVDFPRSSGEALHSLEGFTEMPGEAAATVAASGTAPPVFRTAFSRRSF